MSRLPIPKACRLYIPRAFALLDLSIWTLGVKYPFGSDYENQNVVATSNS